MNLGDDNAVLRVGANQGERYSICPDKALSETGKAGSKWARLDYINAVWVNMRLPSPLQLMAAQQHDA